MLNIFLCKTYRTDPDGSNRIKFFFFFTKTGLVAENLVKLLNFASNLVLLQNDTSLKNRVT